MELWSTKTEGREMRWEAWEQLEVRARAAGELEQGASATSVLEREGLGYLLRIASG